MKKSKLLIMNAIVAIMLLTSCSVTKMRYTRGLNVEFLKRNDKTEINVDKHAKVAVKKANPKHILANDAEIALTQYEPIAENNYINRDKIDFGIQTESPSIASNKTKSSKSNSKVATKNNIIVSPKKNSSTILDPKPIQYSDEKKSGAWGILGFIFGFLSLFAFILAPLGLLFSLFGLSRRRKLNGLAIAGFVLSLLVLLVVISFL